MNTLLDTGFAVIPFPKEILDNFNLDRFLSEQYEFVHSDPTQQFVLGYLTHNQMQNELADEFYREQKVKRDNELETMRQKARNTQTKGESILQDLPLDVAKYIMQYHDGSGTEKTRNQLESNHKIVAREVAYAKSVDWDVDDLNEDGVEENRSYNVDFFTNPGPRGTWHRKFITQSAVYTDTDHSFGAKPPTELWDYSHVQY